MASTTHPETVNDEAASNSSVNDSQIVNDVDGSTPKRAKLDGVGESSPIKRTGSAGRNKRSDAVMMAEAKAAFGDLDTSEGRRLRKRSSEPTKVEEKKQTPRRSTSRSKGSTKAAGKREEQEEEEEEDTVEEAQPAEKIGSNGKPEDILAAEADRVTESKSEEEENVKLSVDKSGNSDEAEAKDSKESKSEDIEKSEESKDKQPAEDGDKEKPSEVKSTSG